jgi:flagellar M-ring protein FliF
MTVQRGRRVAVGVAAVLLLWPLASATAFASTGTVSGADTASAVQSVLDRVLGPGGATVVVSDTVRTSSSTSTSTRWGSGAVGSIATQRLVTPGGTVIDATQQDLVGGTTTTLATPSGALVRQTVAVAVDRARIGSTSVAALRRLVAGAAGIVPSRGDRVSITVAPFAHRAAVVAPAASPVALLLPYAVPAIWAIGAIAALLILVRAARGPKRRLPAGP